MSGNNRAARRRAERKHGGPPPDYWNDYRRPLQVGIAVLVLVVLGTAFLIVRARQASQSEVESYCEVYDQTHDDIAAVTNPSSTTTTAPITTVVTPGDTTVGSVPGAPGSDGTTVATAAPGTVPDAGTSTTTTPIDPTERMKAAVEKRQQVGPQQIRDAWAVLAKAITGTKMTASQQNEVQAARTVVNDYAKNECHRDPPDV